MSQRFRPRRPWLSSITVFLLPVFFLSSIVHAVQVEKKFISPNAVDGSKIRLSNNETLRARNAANSGDIDLLKLTAADKVQLSTFIWPTSDGSNGQVLTTNGSSTLSFQTVGTTFYAVTLASGALTVTNSQDYLSFSGSSATIAIFSAVGNTGKVLKFKHAGTSLTQVFTLDPNSTETIDGQSTYQLWTNGESLGIISNGTNWDVLNHKSATSKIAYTPTIGGFGTVTSVSFFWQREASDMLITGTFSTGTIQAALATISLPSGVNIDSNAVSRSNTTAQLGPTCGLLTAGTANPQRGNALTATGTSTVLIYAGSNSTPLTPSNGTAFASSTLHAFEARVPISGWQP